MLNPHLPVPTMPTIQGLSSLGASAVSGAGALARNFGAAALAAGIVAINNIPGGEAAALRDNGDFATKEFVLNMTEPMQEQIAILKDGMNANRDALAQMNETLQAVLAQPVNQARPDAGMIMGACALAVSTATAAGVLAYQNRDKISTALSSLGSAICSVTSVCRSKEGTGSGGGVSLAAPSNSSIV